jgi:hypothetical protein
MEKLVSMTNHNDQQRHELTPQGLQNLVGFFLLLEEIEQSVELEKRMSSYSLLSQKNEYE